MALAGIARAWKRSAHSFTAKYRVEIVRPQFSARQFQRSGYMEGLQAERFGSVVTKGYGSADLRLAPMSVACVSIEVR